MPVESVRNLALIVNDEPGDSQGQIGPGEEAVDGDGNAIISLSRVARDPVVTDVRPPGQFWQNSATPTRLFWSLGSGTWAQLVSSYGFSWQLLPSDPAGSKGDQYFNTTDNHPRIHDGTAYRPLGFATTLTPAALTVAGTGAVGTGLDYARNDHVHAMPGLASGSADGFLSIADWTKLNNATASPTANTVVYRDANGRYQSQDPLADQDVVNLRTLRAVVAQQDPKGSVRARTTTNIDLANPSTAVIDTTVTLAPGDRVGVMAQSAPAQNGIYVFNGVGVALTRATDADTWDELVGAYVIAEAGASYADTGWLCTVDQGGTLGTTAVTWMQFGNAIAYSAANDPTITGTGVYHTTAGTQFRFRAIKAGSTKVAISLSGSDILVDVTEANFSLNNIGGTLGVAKGGTGATTAAGARTNLGVPGIYRVVIGNGVATTFTITHNLGNEYAAVDIQETTGLKRKIHARVSTVDANSLTIEFRTGAPATNSYAVTVIG